MSCHVTDNYNRYHCCSMNSTSIVLKRHYRLQEASHRFTATIAMPLRAVQFKPTSATFEMRLACVFRFLVYRYTETNKNIVL